MSREALDAAKFAKELAKIGIRPNDTDATTDYFNGTVRAETFDGGRGIDTVIYHDSTSGVTVNLYDNGVEKRGFAAGDTLISIENVVGSKFNDTINGAGEANSIHGYDGNDVIHGNGGSDKIYGGDGNDVLSGSADRGQTVLLNGGADVDTLIFATRGGNAELTTGSGRDGIKIEVDSRDAFKVVITDFQPYWESFGNTVTAQEALAGDQLLIEFSQRLGNNLDSMSAYSLVIDGDDLTMHFENGTINGDIIFEDIGQFVDLNSFTFNVDTQISPGYDAV